jgi:hypothetical protein
VKKKIKQTKKRNLAASLPHSSSFFLCLKKKKKIKKIKPNSKFQLNPNFVFKFNVFI